MCSALLVCQHQDRIVKPAYQKYGTRMSTEHIRLTKIWLSDSYKIMYGQCIIFVNPHDNLWRCDTAVTHPSLSITLEEKRKGLRAVYLSHRRPSQHVSARAWIMTCKSWITPQEAINHTFEHVMYRSIRNSQCFEYGLLGPVLNRDRVSLSRLSRPNPPTQFPFNSPPPPPPPTHTHTHIQINKIGVLLIPRGGARY